MVDISNKERAIKERYLKDYVFKASKEYMIVIALLISVLVFSIASKYFFTANNLLTVLLQSSTISIVAIGQAFVILGGQLDLSVGQNVCVSGYVAAILMVTVGLNPWLALLIGVLCACIIGLINGIMVAYVGIPSFIATLGMMSACQGIARLVSQAKSIAPLPDEISVLGRGYVMGIPVSVVIMLVLYVILSFVARKTILGRYIYSIGGSKEAAFFSGINVKKYSMMTFVISGFLAGLGSVVLLSRLGAASVTNGKAYEFDAIIGCVLGGVSMAGGKGKLIQVLFGVLFLTIFFNGMTQLNVNPFLQDVLKGVVLVLAVTIDVMRNKLRN